MTTTNLLLANIVKIIHILFIIFVILTPFIKNIIWLILVLHIVIIISLIVHWITNQDVCFLTWLECYLKGIPSKDSFIHSLVSPIYKIENDQLKLLSYIITPLLGFISMSRLFTNKQIIKSDIENITFNSKLINLHTI